jgi:hypothetical protein
MGVARKAVRASLRAAATTTVQNIFRPVTSGRGLIFSPPAATTSAPITALNGLPIVSASDLQSDAFGLSWGIDRSWIGMDDTGPVGNGWAIGQLPYLTVTEPNYSRYGILDSAQQSVEDRVNLVEGGGDGFAFRIAPTGSARSDFNSFASLDGEPLALKSGTDGSVPVMMLTDAAGDVTEFYDAQRDSSGRPIPLDLRNLGSVRTVL